MKLKCWLFDSGDGFLPVFAQDKVMAARYLQSYYIDTEVYSPTIKLCKSDLKRKKEFDQYAGTAQGVSTYHEGVAELTNKQWKEHGYSAPGEGP
jgi:hypothetical protein